MSPEVDFWNSAEVGIFSELVHTSVEFYGIPFAQFRGKARNTAEFWGKTTQNSERNTGSTYKLTRKKLKDLVCSVHVHKLGKYMEIDMKIDMDTDIDMDRT